MSFSSSLFAISHTLVGVASARTHQGVVADNVERVLSIVVVVDVVSEVDVVVVVVAAAAYSSSSSEIVMASAA